MDHIEPLHRRVAQAVTTTIEDTGVTQVWLCEKTGIPRTTLVRRLSGHSPFTVSEIERLAAALRVSPLDLGFRDVA